MTEPEGSSARTAGGQLGPEAVRALFGTARRALAEALRHRAAGAPRPASRVDGPFYTVNVTVYREGRLCASMGGRGGSLAAAAAAAAASAAYDRRFGAVLRPEQVPACRLDLWVLTGMVRFASAADVLATLDMGQDGVELRLGRKTAYYKPSVPLTSGITDPERLMRKLARKAGLAPGAWRNPRARLWRTSWEHFVDAPPPAGGPVRLRRLRPERAGPLDAVVLAQAARSAQERLLAGQAARGSYLYRYHPLTNRVLDECSNLVRQAGTAYAIARSAAREPDPGHAAALRRSAANALGFLLGLRAPSASGGCFIRDPASPGLRGDLGTAALTLLAMQYGPLRDEHEAARQSLRAWMLGQQDPDGSFRCRSDSLSAAADGRKQSFFPGEAILALAHEAARADAASLRALDRGFAWYRSYFRRAPTSAFVPWQVDAWRLFTEVAENRADAARYPAFVFELTDWLLRRQLTADTVPPDIAGAFARPGGRPGFSTATYTEAVIRAFGLAARLGDDERAQRYRAAARAGLGFALRLQISPAARALFRVPELAVGGVTAGLGNFALRCDHDQHLITACLTALETPLFLD